MSFYQVSATYRLTAGKPQLAGISYNTTSEYFPYLVGSCTSYLSHSRYFHTQAQAQHYINYLYSRYPKSTAPPPVLDELQLTLF